MLLYRGYPIEQLAEYGDFLETCYVLLYGELPTASQKQDFDYRITRHTMVHEQMARFFQGFRRDAHPMAVMVASVGALSAFYHDSTDIADPHQRMVSSMRLIAKMPTLAAMAYKYTIGQPFVYPKNDLDYPSNFLRMCFSVPCEEYRPNPILARALDRIFILHADHEQNASTSTVRLAGSSGANPFACIAAGIACLWGPAHGGANEAALKMLQEIGTADRIPMYIAKAKDKNDPFRLMGFGHRVYKNYDPRAKIMQKTTHEVLNELGHKDDPLLEVAVELERIALHDEYFIEKKLYPEHRFLLGHHLEGDGLPDLHVHRPLRAGPHRWLDRAVEGDDRGPFPEDRPSAPALHGRGPARLRIHGPETLTGGGSRLNRGGSPPRPRGRPGRRGRMAPRHLPAASLVQPRERRELGLPLRTAGDQGQQRFGERARDSPPPAAAPGTARSPRMRFGKSTVGTLTRRRARNASQPATR